MTLTIEQVRETRFHMARRSGYDPADVDTFVDRVETTLVQLAEENATLQQQVAALKAAESAGGDPEAMAAKDAEIEGLRRELDEARAAAANEGAEDALARLRDEVDDKARQLAERDAEIAALRAEVEGLKAAATESAAVGGLGLTAAAAGVEQIVVTSAAEASPAVTRLVQMATEQAEVLVGEARTEAERLTADARSEADRVTGEARSTAERVTSEAQAHAAQVTEEADKRAHDLVADAEGRAERIESEARTGAETVTREAVERAAQVDRDAAARRDELFATLEAERDELARRVDHLRDFEGRFRSAFTANLQSHLEALANDTIQPVDEPDLLKDGVRGTSSTPRLDALLGKGE